MKKPLICALLALLPALLPAAELPAIFDMGRYELTPQGRIATSCPAGDCEETIVWGTVPNLTGETGTSGEFDFRQYVTGEAAATATFSASCSPALPSNGLSVGDDGIEYTAASTSTRTCTATFTDGSAAYTSNSFTIEFDSPEPEPEEPTEPVSAPTITSLSAAGGTAPASCYIAVEHTFPAGTHHTAVQIRFAGTTTWYTVSDSDASATEVLTGPHFCDQLHDVRIVAYNAAETVALASDIEQVTTETDSGAGEEAVKWHPGWYVKEGTHVTVNPSTGAIQNAPSQATWNAIPAHFKGMMFDLAWRTIETSFGVYQTAWLAQQLSWAQAAGKQLAINFWPQRISPGNNSFPNTVLPDYLNDGGAVYGFSPTDYGPVARFWKTSVSNRLIAAVAAICTAFNSHPNFELVMLMENAYLVLDGTGPASPEALNAALAEQARQISLACPNTLVSTRWNWSPASETRALAAFAAQYGIGIGSTDAFPTWISDMDLTLKGAGVVSGAQFSNQNGQDWGSIDYRGIIPITPANEYVPFMSNRCYAGPGGILEYLDDTYKATHAFLSMQQAWTGALTCQLFPAMSSAVQAFGALGNTTCPTSIVARGGCNTD